MRWGLGLAVAVWLVGGQVALAAEAATSGAAPGTVKLAKADAVAANKGGDATTGKAAAEKVATVVRPTRKEVVPAPVTRPEVVKKKPAKAEAPTLVARIDLTAQRMYVSAGGEAVGSWKISSGRTGYETPTGRFRPKWISRMHYSRKYDNAPMPYSVFFNGGIATHGTTAVSGLGRPASHGCIRLQTGHARTFYHLVRKHGKSRTRIIVTGRAQQSHIAKRSKPQQRSVSRRQNAFQAQAAQRRVNAHGQRRYSVNAYERRYRERVRRYYDSRRLVWPGDRY